MVIRHLSLFYTMPAATRAAKPAGGRGRGGAKGKVSKKPGNKTATPKKAEPASKHRASKRKRANVSVEDIPDVDTPPSPPQGTHPNLMIINSPPTDPILQGILAEEEEVLKLIRQKEARERIQRLRAQLGEEGNPSQGVSATPGASPPFTTALTPSLGPQQQGNAQVYTQLQAIVPTPSVEGGGHPVQGQVCCHQSGDGPSITGETRARHCSAPCAPFRPQNSAFLHYFRGNALLPAVAETHLPSSLQDSDSKGKPSISGFHATRTDHAARPLVWPHSNSQQHVSRPENGQGGNGGGGKLYCRYFQSGKCRFSHAPHSATIGNNKVQVHHFCASCFRQSGKMVDHPASDPKCTSTNRK